MKHAGIVKKSDFITWLASREAVITSERLIRRHKELVSSVSAMEVRNVKETVFPGFGTLFSYRWEDRRWIIEDIPVTAKKCTVLVHPCEATALNEVLDRVFMNGEHPERDYEKLRSSLELVTIACEEPESTCFCRMVGGDPFRRVPDTLFVVPLEDRLYVECEEPNVWELWKKCVKVPSEVEKEIAEKEKKSREALPDPPLSEEVPEQLYRLFEDEEWDNIAWKCLNCGACTYLCPTCYCFDIHADGRLKGYQLRSWDACMFPRFTLHASGHNPRPGYRERVRQRVLHKFSYFPMREEGRFGCVGCGACVEVCPVNWDIREAVQRMVKKSGAGYARSS